MSTQPPHEPSSDADPMAMPGLCFDLARSGSAVELRDLIARGLARDLANDKGDTLLILAAYHGRLDTVQALLEAGADPERADGKGQTALAAASFKGDVAIVRCLLDGGAAVDGAGGDGRTALMVAARFDRPQIVEVLLERGADLGRIDADGLDAAGHAAVANAYATPRLIAKAALKARDRVIA